MPAPEIVFFVEHSLGGKVIAEALLQAGARVERHVDHFPQNAKDCEWLPEVGKRGWVLLPKDKHIRTRGIERPALLDAKVAALFLTSGNLQAAEMAEAFVKALPRMLETIATVLRPFIARVSRAGEVELMPSD